jgi:hypothetical protein
VFVIAAPDDATRALIDELKPLASKGAANLSPDVCKKLSGRSFPIMTRLLLPASSTETLENALIKVLEKEEGWHHTRDGLTKGHQSIALSDDDAYVAIDQTSGGAKTSFVGGDQPLPLLEGKTLRAKWNSVGASNASFIHTVDMACQAISGDSVDDAQKRRILAEGWLEGGQVFQLGSFERGDAELTVSPLALTVRAKAGPSFTLPGPDAFAASPSITLPGAKATSETSAAFLKSWSFPGGDPEATRKMLRDTAPWGLLVGLPHLGAEMAILGVDDRSDPITSDPSVTRRFDRIEAIETTGTVAVGVLPAGTTLAAAQCALDPAYPKCTGKTPLKLNATVRRVGATGPDHFARLAEVKTAEPKSRYVVLVSKQESAVAGAPIARMASGMHLEVNTQELLRPVASMSPIPIPALVAGDATVEDGQLVVRLVAK